MRIKTFWSFNIPLIYPTLNSSEGPVIWNYFSLNPATIYLLRVINRNIEQDVKYAIAGWERIPIYMSKISWKIIFVEFFKTIFEKKNICTDCNHVTDSKVAERLRYLLEEKRPIRTKRILQILCHFIVRNYPPLILLWKLLSSPQSKKVIYPVSDCPHFEVREVLF